MKSMEAQDVLYQFDAVRRLADAQAQKLSDDQSAYWQPQALWRALDWDSAHDFGFLRNHRIEGKKPAAPAGHVVLIDEIDKASSDVPNGLLELLSARYFEVPALGITVPRERSPACPKNWPLVIITTNEERELPAAFMRRCMVLNHEVPEGERYQDFLLQHGRAHFGEGRGGDGIHGVVDIIDESVMIKAAVQLQTDRANAIYAQMTAPGLAEYLDLLTALNQLAKEDTVAQLDWLDQLNQYAYLKNRIESNGDPSLRQQPSGERILSVPEV